MNTKNQEDPRIELARISGTVRNKWDNFDGELFLSKEPTYMLSDMDLLVANKKYAEEQFIKIKSHLK
jgi:hypothetical protein